MQSTRVFGIFETRLRVAALPSDPFAIELSARFWQPGVRGADVEAFGFFDPRDEAFVLRFSPEAAGNWCWSSTNRSSLTALRGRSGTFVAAAPAAGDPGPVRARGAAFVHANGDPHFSVGTTAYAWIHQDSTLRKRTVATLQTGGRGAAFNKIRMTIFPKYYDYNRVEPRSGLYPFEGHPPRGWRFPLQFQPDFWEMLENEVGSLRAIGVQADLILFHPYDGGHWGFACLGESASGYAVANDLRYLRYVVARLGAYSNVWWSMANEFDYIPCKSTAIWLTLFDELRRVDGHRRMASIHNSMVRRLISRTTISDCDLQPETCIIAAAGPRLAL